MEELEVAVLQGPPQPQPQPLQTLQVFWGLMGSRLDASMQSSKLGEVGGDWRVSKRGLPVLLRVGELHRTGVGLEEFAKPGFKLFPPSRPSWAEGGCLIPLMYPPVLQIRAAWPKGLCPVLAMWQGLVTWWLP